MVYGAVTRDQWRIVREKGKGPVLQQFQEQRCLPGALRAAEQQGPAAGAQGARVKPVQSPPVKRLAGAGKYQQVGKLFQQVAVRA